MGQFDAGGGGGGRQHVRFGGGGREEGGHNNQGEGTTTTGGDDDQSQPMTTLLVGNIPKTVRKTEIQQIFGQVGQLRRCYIQYPKDDKARQKQASSSETSTNLCYVTYATPEDAQKALKELNGHKFGGSKVHIKFAKNTRSRGVEGVRNKNNNNRRAVIDGDQGPRGAKRAWSGEEKAEGRRFAGGRHENPNLIPLGATPATTTAPGNEGTKEERKDEPGPNMEKRRDPNPNRPKQPRPKPIRKKSRLIVRNLSFKATEEKMREYFGSCGQITEVNILKKPDGKMVGCAFVQYEMVHEAAKAVKDLNLKPFLGRPIAIDWALPKKDFQPSKEGGEPDEEKPQIEEDANDESVIEIKAEPEETVHDAGDDSKLDFADPYASLASDIKEEDEVDQDEGGKKKKQIKEKVKEEESDNDSDIFDDEDDDDEEIEKLPIQKSKNDVEEGRTIFLRSLDFGVTEDDLREFFQKWGDTYYTLLCKDKLTEHPKGTAFIKFRRTDVASKCLDEFGRSPSTFTLRNRQFHVSPALSKDKIDEGQQQQPKDKIKQDNRNLFLVREGFIRPGSVAAEGVSASDMGKRSALNATKKQLLRNLAIFVSKTRLCVHNLPPKLGDKALRKIFKKHAPSLSRITEARIMRDMNDVGLGGKAKSKGYGFVSFHEHEDALEALRAINNNPEVFGANHRPIVEFSLENKKALQAKEKRQLKSVENNRPEKRKLETNKFTEEVTNSSTNPKRSKRSKPQHNKANASEGSTPTPTPNQNQKKKLPSKTPANPDSNSKVSTSPTKQKTVKGKGKGKPQQVQSNNTTNKRQRSSEGQNGSDDRKNFSGLLGKPGVSKFPLMRPKGKVNKISRKTMNKKTTKKNPKPQGRKQEEERRMRVAKTRPKKKEEKVDKVEKMMTKHKTTLEKAVAAPKTGQKWYQ